MSWFPQISRIPVSTSYVSMGGQGFITMKKYGWGGGGSCRYQLRWYFIYIEYTTSIFMKYHIWYNQLWSRLQSCGAHDQFDDKSLTCVRFLISFSKKYIFIRNIDIFIRSIKTICVFLYIFSGDLLSCSTTDSLFLVASYLNCI